MCIRDRNLRDLSEHAKILSELAKRNIGYVDDVCGPEAIRVVQSLEDGEAVILGNVRYLTEEVSSFETVVKLSPEEMTKTWLVRTPVSYTHLDVYKRQRIL